MDLKNIIANNAKITSDNSKCWLYTIKEDSKA